MAVGGSFENLSGAVLVITNLGWELAIAETLTFDATDGITGDIALSEELETLVDDGDLRVRNEDSDIIPATEIRDFLFENFKVTDTDLTNASHYYYGGESPAGIWAINRYVKPGGTSRVVANQENNPSYTTIAAAWPDRTTLSYS